MKTSNFLEIMENNKKELIIKKIENVLDQIRPYIQQDGGDIKFVELTNDNVVNVELQGACGTCPYSMMTLKGGVENAMKKAIPEIKSVEAVNL